MVKLGDFGLATAAEDLDGSAKTQVGTPDYMAPEVLQGRPYDAAADVFSLGATLYAMVCSSFPKMLAMFLGQGKALEWPAASEAMVDWRELIAAMLSVEESARPTLLQIGEIAAGLPASAALVGASATAKEEASRPEGVGSAVFAMGVAPVPEAAVAQDVPIPSRPSQPIASEIGRGSLVLLWEPPLPTDVVGHYRILGQVGGANGFDILMDSTGSSEPIVRLTQLEENAWYEFKVVAMNASGGSPASSASLPVQTLGPPRLPAASSSHLLPVQHAMRPRAATPPPQSSTEGAEGLHEDAELLARIAQCKREMLAWDAKFERQHGRPPNDDDRSGDSVYHGALSRYKKLKHAKKRSSQRTGLAITPLDASIQPLTPTPGAPGPYFDGGPYVDEAHLLLERGMHISATAGLLNDGPSSSCATPCASHPSSPRSGATAPLTHSTPSSPAKEGQPRSKKSARHAHDKHNGTSRAHRAAGAKGHGQRGSHGSSHGGGGSRSTADSSASAAGSTMMTIAIKASHPSPRPLAVDESFD